MATLYHVGEHWKGVRKLLKIEAAGSIPKGTRVTQVRLDALDAVSQLRESPVMFDDAGEYPEDGWFHIPFPVKESDDGDGRLTSASAANRASLLRELGKETGNGDIEARSVGRMVYARALVLPE